MKQDPEQSPIGRGSHRDELRGRDVGRILDRGTAFDLIGKFDQDPDVLPGATAT